jgi:hypothetical protein
MPKELKKLKNLKLLLLNTMKPLLSSLNAEDFSLITLKELVVKKFSSKRTSPFQPKLNYLLKVLPSYKNISKVPSEEPLNSHTENHGPKSSRP